jgi:hypothetical protein
LRNRLNNNGIFTREGLEASLYRHIHTMLGRNIPHAL